MTITTTVAQKEFGLAYAPQFIVGSMLVLLGWRKLFYPECRSPLFPLPGKEVEKTAQEQTEETQVELLETSTLGSVISIFGTLVLVPRSVWWSVLPQVLIFNGAALLDPMWACRKTIWATKPRFPLSVAGGGLALGSALFLLVSSPKVEDLLRQMRK